MSADQGRGWGGAGGGPRQLAWTMGSPTIGVAPGGGSAEPRGKSPSLSSPPSSVTRLRLSAGGRRVGSGGAEGLQQRGQS